MPTESWVFTVEDSPEAPGLETPGGLAIVVTAPCTDHSVTVMVNPSIDGHDPKPEAPEGVELAQSTFFSTTNETVRFGIEVGDGGKQWWPFGADLYALTLLRIGHVTFDGQQFPNYEFHLEHFDLDDSAEFEEGVPAEYHMLAVYNRGMRRGREKDFNGAVADFDTVIENPATPLWLQVRALAHRSLAKRRRGDWKGAIEDLTTVVEMDGVALANKAGALVNRAAARKSDGDQTGARADAEAVLEIPNAPDELKERARAILEEEV